MDSGALNDVLLLCLLAVLAGGGDLYGRRVIRRENAPSAPPPSALSERPPPHDRLGKIFAAPDAEAFQRCFVSWVSLITKIPAEVIAIDGKTSRRSCKKKCADDALHTVSAFAAQQRLIMGQTKVDAKSNEIVAIPIVPYPHRCGLVKPKFSLGGYFNPLISFDFSKYGSLGAGHKRMSQRKRKRKPQSLDRERRTQQG